MVMLMMTVTVALTEAATAAAAEAAAADEAPACEAAAEADAEAPAVALAEAEAAAPTCRGETYSAHSHLCSRALHRMYLSSATDNTTLWIHRISLLSVRFNHTRQHGESMPVQWQSSFAPARRLRRWQQLMRWLQR